MLARLHATTHLQQNFCVEDVGAHTQLLGSLTTNQSLVTSDHLHQQALQDRGNQSPSLTTGWHHCISNCAASNQKSVQQLSMTHSRMLHVTSYTSSLVATIDSGDSLRHKQHNTATQQHQVHNPPSGCNGGWSLQCHDEEGHTRAADPQLPMRHP